VQPQHRWGNDCLLVANMANRERTELVLNDIAIARALHVLAVVIWIGGVAIVATVILPAVRRDDFGADQFRAFQAIEHRFAWQARIAVIIAGVTGFYMCVRLDLWARFASAQFWWMHAMVFVWLLFAFVLFVAEPLVLRRRFHDWGTTSPETALTWLYRGHVALLALSVITIFGAVTGAYGWSIF
jgi:uncharacterized membrane protein